MKPSTPTKSEASVKIVVLHRGWVVVGEVHAEGNEVVIDKSSCIRRWGTTKGLGEIAQGGPTTKTQLDPMGTVRVHQLAVVLTLDCVSDKWANSLK